MAEQLYTPAPDPSNDYCGPRPGASSESCDPGPVEPGSGWNRQQLRNMCEESARRENGDLPPEQPKLPQRWAGDPVPPAPEKAWWETGLEKIGLGLHPETEALWSGLF